LRLSVLAVAIPALVLAWLGWRTLQAERSAWEAEARERAASAERVLALQADDALRSVERSFAAAAVAGGRMARRRSLRVLTSSTPLIDATFVVAADGRFELPGDRTLLVPPAKKDSAELEAWREVVDRVDIQMASDAPSDGALAAALLGGVVETFDDPDLKADLQNRLALVHQESGAFRAAMGVLEELVRNPATRAAREPLGPSVGIPAALRLAELYAGVGRMEAAVGVLADLLTDLALSQLRLDEAERPLVLASVRAQLRVLAPERAEAVEAAAQSEAALVMAVKEEVLPRLILDSAGGAGPVAGDAGMVRVVLPPAPGGRFPRGFSLLREADGRVSGFKFRPAVLARRLSAAIPEVEEAWSSTLTVVDSAGRSVTPGEGGGDGAGPLPGAGRSLIETIPQWRVVASPRASSDREAGLRQQAGLIVMALSVALLSLLLAAWLVSRELELARLRQEFVESVTHELRTPITAVRSLAEVLLQADGALSDERVRLYHESIARESVRLSTLVENVLRMARLERGANTLAVEDVNPCQLVEEVLETFQRLPEGAGREVRVNEQQPPDSVRIDRSSAVQGLLNLLSNAAKYSPPEAMIDVVIGPLAGGCGGVRLAVRDRGRGVPVALRERLFEPFFRERPEDPTRPGTGLGLRVTRELARGHGGDVCFEDPVDGEGGSVFVLELPSQGQEKV
jgi:signal transduction histidine kinase